MVAEEAVRELRRRYTFVDSSHRDPDVIVVNGVVRLTLDEARHIIESRRPIADVIADRAKCLRARLQQRSRSAMMTSTD